MFYGLWVKNKYKKQVIPKTPYILVINKLINKQDEPAT